MNNTTNSSSSENFNEQMLNLLEDEGEVIKMTDSIVSQLEEVGINTIPNKNSQITEIKKS